MLVLLLSVGSLNAQIINDGNKDKIRDGIKNSVNDALDAVQQDAHPTGEHSLWDTYIVPKVSLGISSLPGGGGKPELGFSGGAAVECFVAHNLSLSFEMTYAHQGGNDLKRDGQKWDYNLNYLHTDYLIHWYPWPYRALSFYTGLQASRLMSAKAHSDEYGSEKIKDELHGGEVSFPIGVAYEWKQWQFEARYFYSPRHLASSKKAKNILGNSTNMMLLLTVGYRIQIL